MPTIDMIWNDFQPHLSSSSSSLDQLLRRLRTHECTIEQLFAMRRVTIILEQKLTQIEDLILSIRGEDRNTITIGNRWKIRIAEWWKRYKHFEAKQKNRKLFNENEDLHSLDIETKRESPPHFYRPLNSAIANFTFSLMNATNEEDCDRANSTSGCFVNEIICERILHEIEHLSPVRGNADFERMIALLCAISRAREAIFPFCDSSLLSSSPSSSAQQQQQQQEQQKPQSATPIEARIFDAAFRKLSPQQRNLYIPFYDRAQNRKNLYDLQRFIGNVVHYGTIKRKIDDDYLDSIVVSRDFEFSHRNLPASIKRTFDELPNFGEEEDDRHDEIETLQRLLIAISRSLHLLKPKQHAAINKSIIFDLAFSKLSQKLREQFCASYGYESSSFAAASIVGTSAPPTDTKSLLGLRKFIAKQISFIAKSNIIGNSNTKSMNENEIKSIHKFGDERNRIENRVAVADFDEVYHLPIVCLECAAFGHMARDCPNSICFRCSAQGHMADRCETFQSIDSSLFPLH